MLNRAYYEGSISSFLLEDDASILGKLVSAHSFDLDIGQKSAWTEEILNLKRQIGTFPAGRIFFEFSIPRMGKRVDVVLLIQGTVFVVEYKTGAREYDRHAIDQVVDYALDLKNFHEGSHHRQIVPILVATRSRSHALQLSWSDDNVASPILSNGDNLGELIANVITSVGDLSVRTNKLGGVDQELLTLWAETGYKPTPTIVEAAQALYCGHAVEEISRSDAGAHNLTNTAKCISDVIERAKANGRKCICFVTGVPGAGKTLAGLNISTRKVEGTKEHAVFLSGNGPLVQVLREALVRDEVARHKRQGRPISKEAAKQRVSAFIQNIHHFRDEGLRSDAAPFEHVVIFDEAQRAWNQTHAEKFMVQKRGVSAFDFSEPEFLISLMDRRQNWCTIVCLIGGGQEINTGEAGLTEWFAALSKRFRHWDVFHSGQLNDSSYNWGQDLCAKLKNLNAVEMEALHLSVSMRSYRAERLSDFVGAIIEGDAPRAYQLHSALLKYPLVLTRSIERAKYWLRQHARGTERYGLVASSGAMRLKPEGIHVKASIDPTNWFLNGKDDVRSSYYLEDAASEFDIQGLELDWTGVCWDADLRMENDTWGYYAFKGTKWQKINDSYRRRYLANAYRVLLTRARQGMVIFVPEGDEQDYTRRPAYYDRTYDFLVACGVQEI